MKYNIFTDLDQVNVHNTALSTGSFNIFISSKPWLFLVTGISIIKDQQRKGQTATLLLYNATTIRTRRRQL